MRPCWTLETEHTMGLLFNPIYQISQKLLDLSGAQSKPGVFSRSKP